MAYTKCQGQKISKLLIHLEMEKSIKTTNKIPETTIKLLELFKLNFLPKDGV
jgi:hypothetical protein